MQPQDPNYKERIQVIFNEAAFIQTLGIEYKDCGPGWCETTLAIQQGHLQQDGFVHAGVLGTIADHTAGAAAATLMGKDEIVLTVEYKLHLLRPAQGDILFCHAEVLRPGKTISVVEAEVYTLNGRDTSRKLVSKLIATMSLVKNKS
jgi:uncharacterized protein (TIGR00369 family)